RGRSAAALSSPRHARSVAHEQPSRIPATLGRVGDDRQEVSVSRTWLHGFLVFCICFGGAASAQPPSGPEFRVNPSTAGDQTSPDVAIEPITGEFLVQWLDTAQGRCLGRRFSAAGTPLGAQFFSFVVCTGGAVMTGLAPGGWAAATINPSYGGIAGT